MRLFRETDNPEGGGMTITISPAAKWAGGIFAAVFATYLIWLGSAVSGIQTQLAVMSQILNQHSVVQNQNAASVERIKSTYVSEDDLRRCIAEVKVEITRLEAKLERLVDRCTQLDKAPAPR